MRAEERAMVYRPHLCNYLLLQPLDHQLEVRLGMRLTRNQYVKEHAVLKIVIRASRRSIVARKPSLLGWGEERRLEFGHNLLSQGHIPLNLENRSDHLRICTWVIRSTKQAHWCTVCKEPSSEWYLDSHLFPGISYLCHEINLLLPTYQVSQYHFP